MRVEFTSAAEAQGNVKPFLVPTRLERSDFLDEQKKPLELPAFKALVEARGGRFYADGLEPYLRDMGQPAHLNFERAVLRNLLPTAMSFTFLRSFDEFCRQFILPAERLDVSDVTESYKTFLRYEADLLELKDQLQRRNTSAPLPGIRPIKPGTTCWDSIWRLNFGATSRRPGCWRKT